MGFCPFLSFKQKNLSGTIYDELGAAVSMPGGTFIVGAVFKPSGFTYYTDGDSSDFDTDGFFVCPQNNRCQAWGGEDCGLKSPPAAEPGASAATLLNEFLGGSDLDDLDLTSLGVAGSAYGQDFYIDDDENIPTMLNAAHDHPDFDASGIVDRAIGTCDVTVIAPGNDSTAEWEYEIVATDGTTDFVSAGVETTMYIVIGEQGAFIITSIDDSTTLSLNLGLSDDPPLTEGSSSFKVDPKRILWSEYLSLFSDS